MSEEVMTMANDERAARLAAIRERHTIAREDWTDEGDTAAHVLVMVDVPWLLADIERLEQAIADRDEITWKNLERLAHDFRETYG